MYNKNRKTMKKNTTKASAVTKKAVAIYEEQKATYQKMLRTKVRQGKKVTTAARETSAIYKQMYGSTPTARWHRALREAKSETRGVGTMGITKRPARPKKK